MWKTILGLILLALLSWGGYSLTQSGSPVASISGTSTSSNSSDELAAAEMIFAAGMANFLNREEVVRFMDGARVAEGGQCVVTKIYDRQWFGPLQQDQSILAIRAGLEAFGADAKSNGQYKTFQATYHPLRSFAQDTGKQVVALNPSLNEGRVASLVSEMMQDVKDICANSDELASYQTRMDWIANNTGRRR